MSSKLGVGESFVQLTNFSLSHIRMESTPLAVHVWTVMRESAVKPTPMTAIPLLVKMVAHVRTLSMATPATALLGGVEIDAM